MIECPLFEKSGHCDLRIVLACEPSDRGPKIGFGPRYQKLRNYEATLVLVVCSLHTTVFHGVAHIP